MKVFLWILCEMFVDNYAIGRLPSKYLSVQSHQKKHYKNVWNRFKFTNKNAKPNQWNSSGIFIVDFEHILQLYLVFQLLTLNK